jgi:glucose-6-phosphate isomerase
MAYPTPVVLKAVRAAVARYQNARHLILIGIGGSSLGVEAVASLLGETRMSLTVLDMIDPESIARVVTLLAKTKKLKDVVIVVVSKSGATTETVVNAGVVVRILAEHFGSEIYTRIIFVGDPNTPLQAVASKQRSLYLTMPPHVGGRFSVPTEVGLVPLTLLGYDVDRYREGFCSVMSDAIKEAQIADRALTLYAYLQKQYRHFNLFCFDRRLLPLMAWYRQLFAESLGKETTTTGKPVTLGMLPTISTPVELHSVGQLLLARFPGVYTEFVSVDDSGTDYKIGPTKIASAFSKFTLREVGTALYGGVIGAWQDRELPYRATVFTEEDLTFSIGQYQAAAMLEVMYLAKLLDVSCFDQPNVELYKQKTRSLLGV